MSKAAIIVEMPQCCHECRFWFSKATEPVKYRCMAAQKYIDNLGGKPNWCPLRDLPERKAVIGIDGATGIKELELHGRQKGWNACIDKILDN